MERKSDSGRVEMKEKQEKTKNKQLLKQKEVANGKPQQEVEEGSQTTESSNGTERLHLKMKKKEKKKQKAEKMGNEGKFEEGGEEAIDKGRSNGNLKTSHVPQTTATLMDEEQPNGVEEAETRKKKKKKDKKPKDENNNNNKMKQKRQREEEPEGQDQEQDEENAPLKKQAISSNNNNNNSNGIKKKSQHQDGGKKNSNDNNSSDIPSTRGNGFRKNFYSEHSLTKSIPEEEVAQFREQHNITLTDASHNQEYKPILSFDRAGYPEAILKSCKSFSKPTPIQSQCWPIILSGRDVVGIAETGSGKTLAFTLPALVHILDQGRLPSGQGPVVLVLSPTRELAMQTAEVCTASTQHLAQPIYSTCIYGGVPKGPQYQALSKGAHIVVATPGRLMDLMNEGRCSLDRVTFLILDEADRMLDLGFEQDIRTIISYIRKDRQTVMFSATWPPAISSLANEFLLEPVKVTIGSEDLAASRNVTQLVDVVDPQQKDQKLKELLRKYHSSGKNRVLVFALYKKEAERVEEMLSRSGWRVQAIHGDKSQNNRTQAMQSFKDGSQPLLVATDVAARGLDIPNVEYVINYTFPLTIEDYVHRIGRTGRAGKKGVSHTLFTMHDKTRAAELISVLRETNQPVPDELVKYSSAGTKKKEHALYGGHFREIATGQPAKTTHVKFDADD